MIGLWKIKSGKGWISHNKGLTPEQISQLQALKVGDKLVIFENDVREGETGPSITLKRSTLHAPVQVS